MHFHRRGPNCAGHRGGNVFCSFPFQWRDFTWVSLFNAFFRGHPSCTCGVLMNPNFTQLGNISALIFRSYRILLFLTLVLQIEVTHCIQRTDNILVIGPNFEPFRTIWNHFESALWKVVMFLFVSFQLCGILGRKVRLNRRFKRR